MVSQSISFFISFSVLRQSPGVNHVFQFRSLFLSVIIIFSNFYYFIHLSSSHLCKQLVFHERQQFPQITRTLLSILAILNYFLIWMISSLPLISKSSSTCTNSYGDCMEYTNYNWYHCHFHVPLFFHSLARSWYLNLFLHYYDCSCCCCCCQCCCCCSSSSSS